MRSTIASTALFLASSLAWADSLPVITSNPQNQTVAPGINAAMSVAATGATAYQWRFNGSDISRATTATLTVTNPQFANAGYYMAVARNSFGWVPSQMAYLSVVDTQGVVPFSTTGNAYSEVDDQATLTCSGCYRTPITNVSAQLMAGPALDEFQPVAFAALA